jgi:hypothetical protein
VYGKENLASKKLWYSMVTDIKHIQEHLLAMRKPMEDSASPYSSRNSSKGAMLTEAKILFSYLAKGNSLDSARRGVFQDNIFGKKTYQTRKKCWIVLHSRYFPKSEGLEQIHPIIALFRSKASEKIKEGVLCYHFATSDLFSYEATTELIYDLYRQGLFNIAPRNIHEFLDLKKKVHPEISKWSPQTRLSLVSHYLSAMRDFGILEGKNQKKIHRPTVEEDLFLYIVTYLRDCGKSPRAILVSNDFKLFLLSQQEVELKLLEAQRSGRIKFQKAGHIVSLELPWRSILEYIESIGQQIRRA